MDVHTEVSKERGTSVQVVSAAFSSSHPSSGYSRTPRKKAENTHPDMQESSSDDASKSEPLTVSAAQRDEQNALPPWKWWLGLIIYALTNVFFLRLFEFCAGTPDLKVVLTAVARYYAIALAARLFMRKVVGLKPSFPQFWCVVQPAHLQSDTLRHM